MIELIVYFLWCICLLLIGGLIGARIMDNFWTKSEQKKTEKDNTANSKILDYNVTGWEWHFKPKE